jgi:hypothetical protein
VFLVIISDIDTVGEAEKVTFGGILGAAIKMKLIDIGLAAYRAYLPAITTLVGAVLVAVGLFFGQGQPTNAAFQWFRPIGAAIAAFGAFWSAHRQVQSAAANKERDQKIIDLSEQIQSHLTWR